MKVLIVEDDADVSAALQDLVFERSHGIVITVQTCADAYRQMQHPIDFVILDVDVTDGRSHEMAADLQRRAIPFIFVSSSGSYDLPKGLEHAQFIPKPFEEDELRQVVTLATAYHAKTDQNQELSSMGDQHEKISERAYHLWQTQGEPRGQDEEIWLMAERLVAIDATATDGPVSEIESIRRTLEVPADGGNLKGGHTPAGGSDLVDQDAGGKHTGTGKGN